jgi:hypothetical protein
VSSPRRSNFRYSVQPLLDYADEVAELLAERELLIRLLGVEQHHQVLEALKERIDLQEKKKCPPHFLIGLTGPKQQNIQSTWDSFITELSRAESELELQHDTEAMALCATIEDARDYYLARRLQLRAPAAPSKPPKGSRFKNNETRQS